MHRRLLLFVFSLLALGLRPAAAQLLSNSSLQGSYYVRQVAIDASPTYAGYAAQGTITFKGDGTFVFQGTEIDTTQTNPTARNLTVNGNYSVQSSGILSMTSLIDTNGFVFGGVANNIVVASTTEPVYANNQYKDSYYDILVAIPASQSSTNATLNGNYRFVSLDFLSGSYKQARQGTFTATANGQGSLGTLNITGQAANLNPSTTTQTINGAAYNLSANGSGTLTLPTSGSPSSLLISGNKTLYVSADGNFVIGGSANGYDLILGVKALSGGGGASIFNGLYYSAGVYLDATSGDIANNSQLVGYSGSVNANGKGVYISNTRYNADGYNPYDETYSTMDATPDAQGTLAYQYYQYFFGANGNVFLGTGLAGNYEIDLGVKVPPFTGPGVFLNPVGVVNGASFAPITNPIAPGELINLFGSGLASQTTTASSLPFPTTLGGVQVTVNGTQAPIYFVSPNQIAAVVPYSITADGSFAEVQVTNNGTQSNVVRVFTAATSPGIFSLPPGGVGTGAILRQNSTVVSSSNRATKGETIQIFLTGLGAVAPATPAGAAGPSAEPFSRVSGNLTVYIDGQKADVAYAGLAPGLAGLYQINAKIPSNAGSGDVYVDIATDDAYHTQVTVPVAP